MFTLQGAWLPVIDLYFIASTMRVRGRKSAVLCENVRWLKEHEKGMRRIHG